AEWAGRLTAPLPDSDAPPAMIRRMSAHITTSESPSQPSDLFGHPRGLSFLFATEMWERFSYYGMRALLVLYMVKYLIPDRSEAVLGFAGMRGTLEWLFGPLGTQPLASQIYGLYTAFVYLTPLLG